MKGTRVLFLALVFIVTIFLTSCSQPMKGSEIFKTMGVRKKPIDILNIEYTDFDNPLNSEMLTFILEDKEVENELTELKNLIYTSKGIFLSEDNDYIPISDSTHYFNLTFIEDVVLEFYYKDDENILVWYNTNEIEGKKVVEYHFLKPKESLSSIFERLREI